MAGELHWVFSLVYGFLLGHHSIGTAIDAFQVVCYTNSFRFESLLSEPEAAAKMKRGEKAGSTR